MSTCSEKYCVSNASYSSHDVDRFHFTPVGNLDSAQWGLHQGCSSSRYTRSFGLDSFPRYLRSATLLIADSSYLPNSPRQTSSSLLQSRLIMRYAVSSWNFPLSPRLRKLLVQTTETHHFDAHPLGICYFSVSDTRCIPLEGIIFTPQESATSEYSNLPLDTRI